MQLSLLAQTTSQRTDYVGPTVEASVRMPRAIIDAKLRLPYILTHHKAASRNREDFLKVRDGGFLNLIKDNINNSCYWTRNDEYGRPLSTIQRDSLPSLTHSLTIPLEVAAFNVDQLVSFWNSDYC